MMYLACLTVLRARQPLTTDPAELSRVQQPDPGLRQQQGVDVISMLEACFQSQQKPRTTVYLSGTGDVSTAGQCDPCSMFSRSAAAWSV